MTEAPERDLTSEEYIARAVELRPLLRKAQADTEKRGHYSPQMRDEFERAGFYRVLQPKRFGGYAFPLPTYSRLIIEVARGCPSTGWCLGLGIGKSFWFASFFPEHVQEEAFRKYGVVHGGSGNGRATATTVDGGYIINGVFNYCSGIPYSTHYIGGAPVDTAGSGDRVSVAQEGVDSEQRIQFVLPREDYTILDDWGDGRMLGMNGSGSNSIQVENAFVPKDHTLPAGGWSRDEFRDAQTGTEGTRAHGNPMYLGYLENFLPGEISAILVGTAWAMIDELELLMSTKKLFGDYYGNNAEVRRAFGEAYRMVDAAEAATLRASEMHMEQCATWERTHVLPAQDQVWRIANLYWEASRMTWEAGSLAFQQVGTSALAGGSRMQRYFRDIAQPRPQYTMTNRQHRDLFVNTYLAAAEHRPADF